MSASLGGSAQASGARGLRTRLLLTRLASQYEGHFQRPALRVPAGGWRRALVVAPHADDEVIGCGGLIQHLVAAGTEVVVLLLTRDGERSLGARESSDGPRERRMAESRAAQGVLGYSQRRQLAFSDRSLGGAGLAELSAVLADELAYWDPDLLALPNADDLHPDHTAAAHAGRASWRHMIARDRAWARRTALAYEVWGPCRADWYLPLDERMRETKKSALGCYASQLEIADYEQVMAYVHARRAALLAPLGSTLPASAGQAEGYELLLPEEAR